MSDVATGDGLPDRLHDILLRMAGRVDDDALTSARELVAIAESDRAVELLMGCLIAGGVPVTPAENGQLRALLDQSRSDPSLADRAREAFAKAGPRRQKSLQEAVAWLGRHPAAPR